MAASALSAASVYFIGNSVTDTVRYVGLRKMAESRGHTQPWGRQMIPGAPLQWLWDHPSDGFQEPPYGYPTNALPNYDWDFLSLQPFDRSLESDLDHIQRFVGLADARTYNRNNMRILVYARWPRQDDASQPAPRDFDTLWLRSFSGTGSNPNEAKAFFESLAQAVRGVYGSERVFMVPVGHAMYELNQKMKAGLVPGYTNIFQIYADGIHLNNVGAYLTACVYYAVLYRDSPVGLTVPSEYGSIPAALVEVIQQTVWDTVRVVPLSGVPSDTNLLITTLAIPPAYAGANYQTTLNAVGGVAPRSWQLVGGSLPTGVSLLSTGVIQGVPAQSGVFDFQVRVADASNPALEQTRAFRLVVDVDTVPVIVTQALPHGRYGSAYRVTLEATGGNGNLTWTLASGTLPRGMSLGGGGILRGSPVQTGTFPISVRVADADSPPDTDLRAFDLVIGEAGPDTLIAPKAVSEFRIDGDFSETLWHPVLPVANTSFGAPQNSAGFDLLWTDDYLVLAVRVLDRQLVAQTAASPHGDSVEVFLDAFNDKEAEFNVQHRQFRFSLDGSRWERGGRDGGVRSAVLLVEGGYQLEVAIPWTNLGLQPSPEMVLGFDLAVNDRNLGGSRQHFRMFGGADAIDPRPSQFGNLVLGAQTVSGTGGEGPPPAGPPPVAYDGFDYALGALHGRGNTGQGFRGNWEMDGGGANFQVVGEESLTYPRLHTTGRYMSKTDTYATVGRYLDEPGAFAPWKKPSANIIGLPGTEIWVSYLVHPLNTTATAKFSLDDGGAVYHDNNGRVRVRSVSGFWELGVMNNAVVQSTGVPVVAGQTCLMVLRIAFGATSTVDLYVNPAVGEPLPNQPQASVSTSSSSFGFNEVNLYPTNGAHQVFFDEIRFGASFASVTPSPAIPPPAPIPSPLPGHFTDPLAVNLGTTAPGAVIRYTVDGSEPGPNSPTFLDPIPIAANTTVKARAFLPDLPASPVMTAVYTVGEASPGLVFQSAFEGWLAANGLGLATSPWEGSPAGGSYLLRFALGLPAGNEPGAGAVSGAPEIVARPGAVLELVFQARRGAGLAYHLLQSGTLGDWGSVRLNPGGAWVAAPGGTELEAEAVGGGLDRVQIRLEAPAHPAFWMIGVSVDE